MEATVQIVVVDDSQPFRVGLRALLSAAEGMELIGEAENGHQAITLAEHLQPDVILMDLNMPDMNGIAATAQILRSSPHIAVLVLTMVDDDDSLFAAMQAGARGYLLKGAPKSVMLRAIRDVAAGAAIFSPAIARRMMTYFSQLQQLSAYAFPELTEREREVLQLMAQHRSNKEIAQLLHLSPKTVRNYTSNIFAKLQVADRAEAILRAQNAGFDR
ncbi:MAG TPA: response regulator transcription factor [Candidatus Sulfomarinibacteraceae bacterium]|nr:response regulator transcription factor [Candidatus Sulfomarinibacteraceae bacterium]